MDINKQYEEVSLKFQDDVVKKHTEYLNEITESFYREMINKHCRWYQKIMIRLNEKGWTRFKLKFVKTVYQQHYCRETKGRNSTFIGQLMPGIEINNKTYWLHEEEKV